MRRRKSSGALRVALRLAAVAVVVALVCRIDDTGPVRDRLALVAAVWALLMFAAIDPPPPPVVGSEIRRA